MRHFTFLGTLAAWAAALLGLLIVPSLADPVPWAPGSRLHGAPSPTAATTRPAPAPGGAEFQVEPTGFRGIVAPTRQVTLNAPMDGTLKRLLVKEGQKVAKGDLLIEMDDGLQRVAVAAAKLEADSESEVKKAQAALDEAQIMLERSDELVVKGAANEWEARRARLQRDQAAASLTSAQEQRVLAKTRWDLENERLVRYRLVAPFDGQVLRVMVQDGATLTQRDPVLSLVALETLEATVYVATERYGQVQVGKTFSLAAGKPLNAKLTGTVKTVDPVFDSASQTFRCVLSIDNTDQKLPAGFVVTLELP